MSNAVKVQLALAFGPAFPEEIADLAEISVDKVKRTLNYLKRKSLVKRRADGKWVLTRSELI